MCRVYSVREHSDKQLVIVGLRKTSPYGYQEVLVIKTVDFNATKTVPLKLHLITLVKLIWYNPSPI